MGQTVDPAIPRESTAAGKNAAAIPQRLRHADLASASWFESRDESSVWIAAYRVFRVQDHEALARQPVVLDLVQTRVRVHLYVGDLTYPSSPRPTFTQAPAGAFELRVGPLENRKEPIGAYLLLVTPFDVDGVTGNEHAVRQRLASVVGLIVALHGRNAAFEKIFDNVYRFADDRTTVSSETVINPGSLDPVTLDDTALDDVAATETAVERMAEPLRSRVRLSLRWHLEAVYDDGVDAVLKHWIALETLAMQSRTDIESLVDLLARAHERQPNAVKDELAVGLIYGLRGRIVHEGMDIPIDSTIPDHMALLYVDAMREVLGRPRWRRALGTSGTVRPLVEAALRV